jgi:hypothetical protein
MERIKNLLRLIRWRYRRARQRVRFGQLDALVLFGNAFPKNSPTFRSGKIGGWRAHFTPAHKQLFNQCAGDLLVKLDYESSLDW